MSATTETVPADTLREVDFPRADQALREDVKRLGALVGEILADQLGDGFLAQVEQVRAAAIRRREHGGDPRSAR